MSRIGVALILLYDLCQRWYRQEEFTGLVPRAALPPHMPTFHQFLEGPVLDLMMMIQVVLALLLLVGFKTRVVGWACWVGLLSLQARTPYLLYGADRVLLVTLFWGNFLPWGCRYSREQPAESVPDRFRSWFLAAYWCQFAFIYLQTAWLKSGPQWWLDHTAVYHAVATLQYRTDTGELLAHLITQIPLLGNLLTLLVLALEYVAPLLVLYRPARNLGVGAIVCLHLAIAVILHVGFFPFISIAAAVGLWLPNEALDEPPRGQAKPWFLVLLLALPLLSSAPIPQPWRTCLSILQIRQRWNMFAPDAPSDHGWYSAIGRGVDGKDYELLVRGRIEHSVETPHPVWASLGDMRLNSLCFRLYTKDERYLGPLLCNYLLGRWKHLHPDIPLIRIELVYYRAEIVPYKVEPLEPRRVYLEPVI